MKSLYSMPEKNAKKIKALLFDLDGTFVSDDKLVSKAYESLENLHDSGVKTIAVTGRPAGWCDLMARWWPIDAVVGENGAFFYKKVDPKIFPVIKLKERFNEFPSTSIIINAANEVLVDQFLSKKI